MITNGFTYVAVLVFMAAVLVTLEKNATGFWAKFFNYVPAVVLCYLVAMLLCTAGVWDIPSTYPVYDSLKNYFTYTMIFTMLLRCDIRKILRLGPKMLFGFFSASVTIVIGFVAAFSLMKNIIGPDSYRALSALCGSWIGGSGNMIAIQSALNVSEADMGYALVVDSINYSVWVMFLLWAIQLAVPFNKWTKASTRLLDEVSLRLADDAKSNAAPITFESLILVIGTSLLAAAVSQNIGTSLHRFLPFLDESTWTILFLTVIGLLAALSPLGKVSGSDEVSNLSLYTVIGLLASRASLLELKDAPMWILTGFLILGIHMVLTLIIAKLFHLDMFTCGVASLANIGGTAGASILAGTYSGALVPVGVLMALLGFIIGTPVGLLTAKLLELLA